MTLQSYALKWCKPNNDDDVRHMSSKQKFLRVKVPVTPPLIPLIAKTASPTINSCFQFTQYSPKSMMWDIINLIANINCTHTCNTYTYSHNQFNVQLPGFSPITSSGPSLHKSLQIDAARFLKVLKARCPS